jgi:short-subunit dehydrogenase
VVDVNVHGVLHGMKIALPRMCARGHGHLVNLASTGGKTGVPGAATYCGTKFFVVGVSEAARLELHGSGVEISCVMPGIVNTELTSGLARPRFAPKELEPEDVAAAIVDALRHPRFEVFVPRSLGATVRIAGIWPRGVREGLARRLRLYEFSDHPDQAARQQYEQRIAPR